MNTRSQMTRTDRRHMRLVGALTIIAGIIATGITLVIGAGPLLAPVAIVIGVAILVWMRPRPAHRR